MGQKFSMNVYILISTFRTFLTRKSLNVLSAFHTHFYRCRPSVLAVIDPRDVKRPGIEFRTFAAIRTVICGYRLLNC